MFSHLFSDVVWPPEYDVDGERVHHRNPHTIDDNDDEEVDLRGDSSSTQEDDDNSSDDDVPLARVFRPHVRRGSERYEVKLLTVADRERMLRRAMESEQQRDNAPPEILHGIPRDT